MAHEMRNSQEREVAELLTREDKERLLDQKVALMKLRSEQIKERYNKIEEDKKWAEQKGCSVTLRNANVSDDDDDAWPMKTERFANEEADRSNVPPRDLRKVLQKKNETRPPQERKQLSTSKPKTEFKDGPPPDPAYNYLADRERDSNYNTKGSQRGDPKYHRGQPQENQRGRRNVGSRIDRTGQQQVQSSYRENEERFHDEERAKYDHWRKERETIDQARIERQKTKEGWKREWDRDKQDSQLPRSEPRTLKDFGHQSFEESSRKSFTESHNFSGDPSYRDTPYRGGRGRGRARQEVRVTPPKAGPPQNPNADVKFQVPPRFRRSPDETRPGNLANQQPDISYMSHSGTQGDVMRHVSGGQGALYSVSNKTEDHRDSQGIIASGNEEVRGSSAGNFSSMNPILITVKNQVHEGKGEPVTRVVQNKLIDETENTSLHGIEVKARTSEQFVKSPKKGIGSGRLLPPPKGKASATRGKDSIHRKGILKNRRTGSQWNEKSGEEVTIGIAVITTPGDKDDKAAENIVKKESTTNSDGKHPDVSSTKTEISTHYSDAPQLDLIDADVDDDDDEWEDIDEASVEYDETNKREHNKSNESIDRFIEEMTLHPDGTNWNIDKDTANIPWSDQMDAESQERHRMENDWPAHEKLPSDSHLSFQSSCSIVESPFEQREVLSDLLAAACDSAGNVPCLKPGDVTEESLSKSIDIASVSDVMELSTISDPIGDKTVSSSGSFHLTDSEMANSQLLDREQDHEPELKQLAKNELLNPSTDSANPLDVLQSSMATADGEFLKPLEVELSGNIPDSDYVESNIMEPSCSQQESTLSGACELSVDPELYESNDRVPVLEPLAGETCTSSDSSLGSELLQSCMVESQFTRPLEELKILESTVEKPPISEDVSLPSQTSELAPATAADPLTNALASSVPPNSSETELSHPTAESEMQTLQSQEETTKEQTELLEVSDVNDDSLHTESLQQENEP